MRSGARIWWTSLALASLLACGRGSRLQPPAGDEEPLLLLNNGPTSQGNPAEESAEAADNSRCHVCHINFATEEFAVTHARAGIGCERCHGESDAHCGDEDNITPPDIMYPKDKINPSCMACHPEEKLREQAQHKMLFAAAAPPMLCTDCHGTHRLAYRTRRWDKATGKLIDDDKVRMIEKNEAP